MSDPAASREGAARGGRDDEAESGREEGHKAAQDSLHHHHIVGYVCRRGVSGL